MPETLAVTMGLELHGFSRVALITDGRFSGATSGPCIGHVSPEAAAGGPIAALRDGDEISIDIPGRSLEVMLSEEEIASRLREAGLEDPRGETLAMLSTMVGGLTLARALKGNALSDQVLQACRRRVERSLAGH